MPLTTIFIASSSYGVGGGSETIYLGAEYHVEQTTQPPMVLSSGTANQVGTFFTVTHPYNGQTQNIPNAYVYVYQDEDMVDIGITDASGTCGLFLPTGTYNLDVTASVGKMSYENYIIASGITPSYQDVMEGNILNSYGDVNEYPGPLLQVTGTLVDENEDPLANANVLVTRGINLIVNCPTDDNGGYSFIVPTGTYDVRLRSEGKNVKLYRNFNFVEGQGFMTELANNDVNFSLGGDWLWTSR